jgi:hypothetical protein
MAKDQMTGLIRALIAVAAGYVGGKGWLPMELLNDIAPPLGLVGVAVWSWFTNKPGKTIK